MIVCHSVFPKCFYTDVRENIFDGEIERPKEEAVQIMLDCLRTSGMSWFRKFKNALFLSGKYIFIIMPKQHTHIHTYFIIYRM